MQFNRLIQQAISHGASDLIITAGSMAQLPGGLPRQGVAVETALGWIDAVPVSAPVLAVALDHG